MHKIIMRGPRLALLTAIGALITLSASAAPAAHRHIVVMVWDGLRPTAINPTDTPNLYRLRESGVEFSDHHSTYPTLTMINASSLATGAFPEHSGFYGNTVYQPLASGDDAEGDEINFLRPVFVEDYAVLESLNRHYQNRLLKVESLFARVQRAGLATVTVGKSGPAFLQDYLRGGAILDENFVWPRSVADALLEAKVPLPLHSPVAYAESGLKLPDDNGDPTALGVSVKLKDDPAADPVAGMESVNTPANRYLMRQFIEHLLPGQQPALALIWLRDPDSTEHQYGPGSPAVHDALRQQDALLGELQAKLKVLKLDRTTDLIVVSDHGHSSVSGSLDVFPPRAISAGTPGGIDRSGGYSVSGEVRLADLLRRADPQLEVFDDKECLLSPSLSGLKIDKQPVQEARIDTDGTLCHRAGTRYTNAVPALPSPSLLGPRAIVIASNGGSEFLYLPRHDADTLARAVRALQAREQIGAIFVSRRRYPELPAGTLAMEDVHIESGDERSPDAIVSYAYDADSSLHGAAGIEFASMSGNRGMHGSFSPRDVHNTLIAFGPSFKTRYRDALPSANVDVAPTIAALLGIDYPADGRVLREALRSTPAAGAAYRVEPLRIEAASNAEDLSLCYSTDIDCNERGAGKRSYRAQVIGKTLRLGERQWNYFDHAEALRE